MGSHGRHECARRAGAPPLLRPPPLARTPLRAGRLLSPSPLSRASLVTPISLCIVEQLLLLRNRSQLHLSPASLLLLLPSPHSPPGSDTTLVVNIASRRTPLLPASS